MADVEPLGELEAFVRERLQLAMQDKAAFDRDGQRLNSQLMQGEINMGTAVIGWIDRQRQGAVAESEDVSEETAEEA